MPLDLKALVRTASVPVSAGVTFNTYKYATPDAAATVTTAGYFDGARDFLKVNDTIDVMAVHSGVGDWLMLKVLTVPAAPGNITVAVNSEAAGT